MLQRKVLSFLDARSLCCAAQSCTALNSTKMCFSPAIWKNLYVGSPSLVKFVTAGELRTGNLISDKWADAKEEAHRKRVVLKNDNWIEAYQLARMHSFLAQQLRAARSRRSHQRATRSYG